MSTSGPGGRGPSVTASTHGCARKPAAQALSPGPPAGSTAGGTPIARSTISAFVAFASPRPDTTGASITSSPYR
ncbi:hypothetical protein [Dactylosporangium sp. NPDC005555]|uniref:hypothetical protein n=1 Tax=Dactylosporangium sp. NPDC005555 TaxID=3154889 RepID=UPI0033BD3AB0